MYAVGVGQGESLSIAGTICGLDATSSHLRDTDLPFHTKILVKTVFDDVHVKIEYVDAWMEGSTSTSRRD